MLLIIEVHHVLEIEPEIRCGAKCLCEQQRRLGRHTPLPIDERVHSLERNANSLSEVGIRGTGDFHDGLAPIEPEKISYDEPLIYIRTDGTEAFSPSLELGVVVCRAWSLPEFRDGLVQLLVADKGEKCNGIEEENELLKAGKARYVYLDTSGNIVLQQKG